RRLRSHRVTERRDSLSHRKRGLVGERRQQVAPTVTPPIEEQNLLPVRRLKPEPHVGNAVMSHRHRDVDLPDKAARVAANHDHFLTRSARRDWHAPADEGRSHRLKDAAGGISEMTRPCRSNCPWALRIW